MAFFKKLKERLFKSSSKIDEGLDAIVEDGGEEEEVELEQDLIPQKEADDFIASDQSNIEVAQKEPAVEKDVSSKVENLEPEKQKETFVQKFLGRKKEKVTKRKFDDEMLEQLEELLIASDMGVETAMRVAANMAQGNLGRRFSTAEIKKLLANEIEQIMMNVAQPLPIYPKQPQVVLVVGVNGSGKTTTIGKLASQFKEAGKNVVIAAGDTFRAAAVEQLQIWGDRANVPVLVAPEGSDPASLAFDALERAQQDKADLLMIDTAGRLQNRTDLMEELAKIVRVLKKKGSRFTSKHYFGFRRNYGPKCNFPG